MSDTFPRKTYNNQFLREEPRHGYAIDLIPYLKNQE